MIWFDFAGIKKKLTTCALLVLLVHVSTPFDALALSATS